MDFPPVHNLVTATFEHQKLKSDNGQVEAPAKAPQAVSKGQTLSGDDNVLNQPRAEQPAGVGSRLNSVA